MLEVLNFQGILILEGLQLVRFHKMALLMFLLLLLVVAIPDIGAEVIRKNLLVDKEHLKHDLVGLFGEWFEFLNEAEMNFQYFAAHDYDKNKKLDGLELFTALTHDAAHAQDDGQGSGNFDITQHLNEAESLIDEILTQDDDNFDGFLDYREFSKVHKKYPGLGESS